MISTKCCYRLRSGREIITTGWPDLTVPDYGEILWIEFDDKRLGVLTPSSWEKVIAPAERSVYQMMRTTKPIESKLVTATKNVDTLAEKVAEMKEKIALFRLPTVNHCTCCGAPVRDAKHLARELRRRQKMLNQLLDLYGQLKSAHDIANEVCNSLRAELDEVERVNRMATEQNERAKARVAKEQAKIDAIKQDGIQAYALANNLAIDLRSLSEPQIADLLSNGVDDRVRKIRRPS